MYRSVVSDRLILEHDCFNNPAKSNPLLEQHTDLHPAWADSHSTQEWAGHPMAGHHQEGGSLVVTARCLILVSVVLIGCASSFRSSSSHPSAADRTDLAAARSAFIWKPVTLELWSSEEILGELEWIDFDTAVVRTQDSRTVVPTSRIRGVYHRNWQQGALRGSLVGMGGGALVGAATAKSGGLMNAQALGAVGGAIIGGLAGLAIGSLLGATDQLLFSDPTLHGDSTWVQLPSGYVETDASFIFDWGGRSRTVSKAGLRLKRSAEGIRLLVPTSWLDER